MTTEKQVEANQANAFLSTGAITVEGKATVSRNAVKHGIFTKDLILKPEVCEESEAEYQALLHGLVESLTPQGEIEILLVEKIAIDYWRLRRVIRFETGSISKYLDEVLKDYYNPWKSGERHHSEDALDKKIEEAKSNIDWNKKYLSCLKKGAVTFNEPIWEGKEIESDVVDDLYRIANGIESKYFSESEREKLSYGLLELVEIKEIIARAGYITDKEIADKLITIFEGQNAEYEREIANLEQERIANSVADKLNAKLCSLPPAESLEKVLKYEKSIQKSIYQNLIMLKKLQGML